MRQILRDVFKVSDPDRKYNAPCGDRFTILETKQTSFSCAVETGDQLVLELREQSFPESPSISRKSLKAHRDPSVGVLDSLLQTKLFEGKITPRIVDVRGEPVRFQHHALRHVIQPAVHRTAEDAKWNAPLTEMCSD